MANLAVVGKLPEEYLIKYARGYRGIERDYIGFPYHYYESGHRIMDIFEEYDKLTTVEVYLHDLEFAKKLRDVYTEAYPNIEREIIELVFDNGDPEFGSQLRGYDVIDRHDSDILKVILAYTTDSLSFHDPFPQMLQLLSKELNRFPNEFQLFRTYEDGLMALNLIQGTFEIFGEAKPHHFYEVAKIYLVE